MSRFYQLPPVGNPVSTSREVGSTAVALTPQPYSQQFYDSGTAALAAALIAVLATREKNSQPEVLLPAYACPDLISAMIFAGMKPILVDLEWQRPWMQLTHLESLITDDSVAILGVNLFGIPERWSLLRKLADKNKLILVEDSAQYFPGTGDAYQWQGDLVVLSFGRGKPVSLLGGGAVLCRNGGLFDCLPAPKVEPPSKNQRLSYVFKAKLYNAVVSPYLYWLPQSLSFLHLGETRYHRLSDIEAMDSIRLDLLAQNVVCYQSDVQAAKCCQGISNMLTALSAEISEVTNLPLLCGVGGNHRLLRYPLLLDADVRDCVYRKLRQAGLGASTMYPASLPKIAGLDKILDQQQSFSGAEDFAARIITLPTHQHVSAKHIDAMKAILKDALQ